MAGAPSERPLIDTDPDMFSVQKAQKATLPPLQKVVKLPRLVAYGWRKVLIER